MGLYEKYILSKMTNKVCGSKPIIRQRQKVVPQAKGRVLEIGFGSGLNLPFYDPSKVDMIWGLEPSAGMRALAEDRVDDSPIDVEFLNLSGEEIPLDENSADTVLVTYTLCTIPDIMAALGGMRRVLKPGGELIFCEHGKAPDEQTQKWQKRVGPVWKLIGGGCHLNRSIPDLIEKGGFSIKNLDEMYIPGPRFASYNYWGCAAQR